MFVRTVSCWYKNLKSIIKEKSFKQLDGKCSTKSKVQRHCKKCAETKKHKLPQSRNGLRLDNWCIPTNVDT